MTPFHPMRTLPETSQYSNKDVLVIFGEVFSRGYVNGVIDEAQKHGMKIIYSTVGRRDKDGQLCPLTAEELAEKPDNLINIPLEAGFDLEPSSSGRSPVDQLQGIKRGEWDKTQLDWQQIEDSRQRAVERFRRQTRSFLAEVENQIPQGSNVFFLHTMAGGVPRAKIVMPTMNSVFKGRGDRHVDSEYFWNTDLGRLAEKSFYEVTADTFFHLVDLSQDLYERVEKAGGSVRYGAYGYHGCEVLVGNEYQWQSYSPYIQGWAKLKLENHCQNFWEKGIHTTVYNCPEIFTNSSSIFQGLEVSLYPLLRALQKEAGDKAEAILNECRKLLKPEFDFDQISEKTQKYLTSDIVQKWSRFDIWPQHNAREQMENMIDSSNEMIEMHVSSKEMMTGVLSRVVYATSGKIILDDSWKPSAPVWWLGHDIIAKQFAQMN